MTEVRLNKYLAETGICSRRQADALIEAGRVTVDGNPAVQGMKVTESNQVMVDGNPVGKKAEPVLMAVYKPKGIVCTTSDRDKDNIVDFLNYPERIYPVGRLDKESEGLVIMTNRGDLVNQILRSANHHEKEYIVQVNKPINQKFLKAMREGVPIPDRNRVTRHEHDLEDDEIPLVMTKPCKCEQIDRVTFRIILTQGLNRQIRRMCEFLGYRVKELKRVRVMNITLGDLEAGSYRIVNGEELDVMTALLKDNGR